MGERTPKLDLYKPTPGETGWGSLINENFDKIDSITPNQIGAEPTIVKKSAFNKDFGTTAGTVCQGNDPRLDTSGSMRPHADTTTRWGGSSDTLYGHAKASSTTPKQAGTAAIGEEVDEFARGDHVHKAQTSVSGNAGTATKLKTPRGITLSGGIVATKTDFDGSEDIDIPVTSVNATKLVGKVPTGSIPSPEDMGVVKIHQGAENKNKYMVTDDNGDVVPGYSPSPLFMYVYDEETLQYAVSGDTFVFIVMQNDIYITKPVVMNNCWLYMNDKSLLCMTGYTGKCIRVKGNSKIDTGSIKNFTQGIEIDENCRLVLTTVKINNIVNNSTESDRLRGTIHIHNGGYLNMITSEINECSITSVSSDANDVHASGGIYIDNGTAMLTERCNINKCTCFNNGGGIYIDNGICSLSTSSISECKSTNDGGGIYLNGGQLTMEDGSGPAGNKYSIGNCSCGGSGGGIYLNGGKITMTGRGGISACSCGVSGGGIYIDNGGTYICEHSQISSCTAKVNGGGILNYNGTATIDSTDIRECKIIENTSASNISEVFPVKHGAGIATNSIVTFTNSIIWIYDGTRNYKGLSYIYISENGNLTINTGRILYEKANPFINTITCKGSLNINSMELTDCWLASKQYVFTESRAITAIGNSCVITISGDTHIADNWSWSFDAKLGKANNLNLCQGGRLVLDGTLLKTVGVRTNDMSPGTSFGTCTVGSELIGEILSDDGNCKGAIVGNQLVWVSK